MEAKNSTVLNTAISSQHGGSKKRGSKRGHASYEDQENDHQLKKSEETKRSRRGSSHSNGMVPKFEVKEEPTDESPPREIVVKDGKLIGGPIDPKKRDEIEQKSCILYPYPRRNPFTVSGRKYNSKRLLDLVLDGEVEGDAETEGNVETDTDYHINGLIYVDDESALINWHGFRYPTWQGKSIVKRGITDGPLQEYQKRKRIMDKVWANIQQTEKLMLSDLMLHYRNMELIQTEDYSQYVTNPGILYLSGLLKREQQINDYIYQYYKANYNSKGPTIMFVDATNFRDSSIPTFEYIMNVEESDNVKCIIEEAVTNKRSCKCGETCKSLVESCCAFKSYSKLAYIRKNVIGNIKKHGERTRSEVDDSSDEDEFTGRIEKCHDFVDQYECGDSCSCTPSSCQQRVMQRGHIHTLVIFRHHLKSWTVRAGNDISHGSFVCEYTGKMMTVKEASMKDTTYQMYIDVRKKEGKEGKLVIDAQEKGNEGRFFAHSCEPSLFPLRIHFDIEGRPKRHVGFFAGRDIKEGEELTFDYYADVHDIQQFHERTALANFTCKCGSKKCRETAYQRMIKQQKNED
ncbi:hypothetical protein PRIPAC_71043 [Pristionchus pacificus]|nr:hypothetical protein PRIPAC_71043 [Pristionchus pacificus]